MSDEKRERVARALCLQDGYDPDDLVVDMMGDDGPTPLGERWQIYYIGLADAAIAACEAWEPIETAPKHGVRILLLVADGRCDPVQIGWFNKWDTACFQGLPINPTPLAWMPLPDPPREG